MLPACNRAVAMSFHFPDVAKTPTPAGPVPMPYPDFAFAMLAVPFSLNVYFAFVPATNLGSKKLMTTGMEAGVMGGVVSGMIKGAGQTIVGSPIVFINMLPAEHLLVVTSGNNYNALGAMVVPSITATFICYRSQYAQPDGSAGIDLDGELLQEIRALEAPRTTQSPNPELVADDDGSARIRIDCFDRGIARRVLNLVEANLGIRRLTIDLRGCRGGDADAALALASDFLPKGVVLAHALDADGDEEPIRSRRHPVHLMPVTILIDRGTASAAELFAGVMQYHRRARLSGEQSYGKATAQTVSTAPDRPARYETVRRYALPDGRHWDGTGLSPDP